jgi:hypothetical protein
MGTTTKEIGGSSFNDMISSVDRRSEYVENRAGANVRLNNFLTPYTLDDKSSILNAPCGYSNGVYASLRPVQTFGPELVTNGDFATDSDWTKGSGWTISGGKAIATSASSGSQLYQNGLIVGKKYETTFTITDLTSGKFRVLFGDGGNTSGDFTSTGTYTVTFTAAGSTRLGVRTVGTTTGSIDNISVKEVTDADFDFTRGSAATRVTKDGLVKNVQILSGELVQNGDFSQIGSEEVTNGNFSQIGSELVVNGNFALNSNWTGVGSNGWSIDTSAQTLNFTNASSYVFQGISTVQNKNYKVVIDVELTSGTLIVKSFNALDIITINTTGRQTITAYFTENDTNANFGFIPSGSNVSGKIYNVSVKEVGQDWNFNNWKLTNNNVLLVDTSGYVNQVNVFVVGKNYKISVDVKDYTSGDLRIDSNGQNLFTPSGSNTTATIFISNLDRTNLLLEGNFRGTITNISVKEVGQNWEFNSTAIFTNNGINITTGGYIRQDVVTVGKKYKLTYDIVSYTSGSIRVYDGTDQGNIPTNLGSNTFNFTAGGSLFYIQSNSVNVNLTITNISLIEITDDTDLPRIDYTDGTGILLLEPQSTNSFPYSEDFANSDWTKDRLSITGNSIISPDGTLNASKITENTENGTHRISDTILVSGTGVACTQSIFAKSGGNGRYLRMFRGSGTYNNAIFDLENGTVVTQGGSRLINTRIEKYPDGWYRCISTYTTQFSNIATYYGLQNGNTDSYQGDGTSHIYLWGAQFEEQSYATSYIPTSGSTVTRNQDVCSNAGSSDLINSTEGVLYAEISTLADENSNRYFSINDGSANNRIRFGYTTQSNSVRLLVVASSIQVDITKQLSNTSVFNKIAIKYKQNDFALWVNGVEIATDTSGNTPSGLSQLDFDNSAGGDIFYGNVRSVAVFKEALTDEELAKITSTTQQEVFYEMRDKMLQINADYYEFGDYTTRLKKLF